MQAPVIYAQDNYHHNGSMTLDHTVTVVGQVNTDHLEQTEAICLGGLILVICVCSFVIAKELRAIYTVLKVMSGFQMLVHDRVKEDACSIPRKN